MSGIRSIHEVQYLCRKKKRRLMNDSIKRRWVCGSGLSKLVICLPGGVYIHKERNKERAWERERERKFIK